MEASEGLEMVRLQIGDSKGIAAAARTISRTFSEDPLIKWLRPGATPWANLEPSSVAWQQRRIQRASAENTVVVLKEKSATPDASEEGPAGFPAVGILCPPQDCWSRYLATLGSRLWLNAIDTLSPVRDEGSSMSRIEVMMVNHERGGKIIRSMTEKPAWYIEVVAVDPAYQGKKFGSKMIQSLIKMCPLGDPIYLECTDEKNVRFYEKFGFKVVYDITLKDPASESDAGIRLWLMAKV